MWLQKPNGPPFFILFSSLLPSSMFFFFLIIFFFILSYFLMAKKNSYVVATRTVPVMIARIDGWMSCFIVEVSFVLEIPGSCSNTIYFTSGLLVYFVLAHALLMAYRYNTALVYPPTRPYICKTWVGLGRADLSSYRKPVQLSVLLERPYDTVDYNDTIAMVTFLSTYGQSPMRFSFLFFSFPPPSIFSLASQSIRQLPKTIIID